jgi:hypothetical protein
MVTPELQEQILSLPNSQKSEIIQMLAHSIDGTWPGISKTPGVMGGEACIRESRIPVWLMVSYRRMGMFANHKYSKSAENTGSAHARYCRQLS